MPYGILRICFTSYLSKTNTALFNCISYMIMKLFVGVGVPDDPLLVYLYTCYGLPSRQPLQITGHSECSEESHEKRVRKSNSVLLNILYNKLVVDELIFFVIPAVKLSNFFTNLFCWMFSSKLSHSLEVYLTTCV